jgi:Zn-dependent peptidase ImmA (M78 family)/transcriptional regulator with XRE-family HTH domain
MQANPSEIFSRRLRQARLMRKLSLRQLSEAIHSKVSYNALAKYEKGEMMPSGEVLAALCSALDQPADFFFRGFTVELAKVEFRKRLRLSAAEEKAILEEARDFFERYGEVEQLLDAKIDFKPPFDKLGHRAPSLDTAESLAEELRSATHWNLGNDPLPNIHELLELNGIKVCVAPTDNQAFDGLSGQANGSPVVVVARWLDGNLPRKRMTEVHELGHVIIPVPTHLLAREREQVMARFAGAFLLPRQPFEEMFGKHRQTVSLGELIQIKAFFGASIMAIMKRAEQLGLITSAVYQRFCMFVSQQQWRTLGEPGDDQYRGDESHGRFQQLVFRAVAEGTITASRGAALLRIGLDKFRAQFQQLFA